MLGAFFDTTYRDWWISYIENPEYTEPERSHWLVRKSASQAFAQGRVQLERRSSLVEVHRIGSYCSLAAS